MITSKLPKRLAVAVLYSKGWKVPLYNVCTGTANEDSYLKDVWVVHASQQLFLNDTLYAANSVTTAQVHQFAGTVPRGPVPVRSTVRIT